jgi:hypothetical protein
MGGSGLQSFLLLQIIDISFNYSMFLYSLRKAELMLKRIKGKGLFLALFLSTVSFEFLNSNFGYIAMAEEQHYIPKDDINAFYDDFDASYSYVSGYIMGNTLLRWLCTNSDILLAIFVMSTVILMITNFLIWIV